MTEPPLARYAIVPERSRVWAEARSTLHPIRVETPGLQGHLDAELADGEVRVGPSAQVALPVELLKSNSTLLDGELQRRLEARKFPFIKGELREARPLGNGRWLLRGDLSLHGRKQTMDVEVTLRQGAGGTIELEGGRVIDMRNFDLDPPKLFFLKVDPEVHIRALLIGKPPAEDNKQEGP